MPKPSQDDFKNEYTQYVTKATVLIHAPETRDSILNMIGGADPVQSIANASVMVMQRLDLAARNAGIELQDTVRIFGANQVVHMIAEVGDAAGKFKLPERLLELALSVATQDYVKGEIAAHRIDPKKLGIALQNDMRQLPPNQRKQIQLSQIRIKETAMKYNHGKGLAAFQGMTSTAGKQGG